jgi:enoyl-CoA hydratase/carnithine racemase
MTEASTGSFQFIKYEKADHIAYLTINRPDVMNALHPPASAEMSQAWQDFEEDDDTWVAIVTGAGERAFSAGMDLRARNEAQSGGQSRGDGAPAAAAPPAQQGERPRAAMAGGFGGLTNPSHTIYKPIIAAVNGYALGGGLELALSCDIIIAAETATFGLPEVKRGIMAGAGGVHRLPRQIPLKIAMGYILTGRHFSAREAERWGLVNEVVPADQLMEAARRWANEIVESAPLSVRASKQAALDGLEMTLVDAMSASYHWQQRMSGSEDSREGVRAFAERRKPVWTGR